MASTLGSLAEHKELKSPRSNNGKILDGAAATASDTGADGTNRQGGGRGRGGGRGGGGRGGRLGRRKWPDNGRTTNDNTDRRPPGRRKHVRSCTFCVAKKRPDTAHIIGFCQWLSSTSKSDLLTTLPNVCLGCLRTKDGAHKCPENLKEGGNLKYFCTICKLNNRICLAPATHTKSSIPETFLGHALGRALHEEPGQAALWTKSCVNRGSLGSTSLLTSSLTLVNEGDTITVEALWDPGSESSFFSSDLLPFAVNKKINL